MVTLKDKFKILIMKYNNERYSFKFFHFYITTLLLVLVFNEIIISYKLTLGEYIVNEVINLTFFNLLQFYIRFEVYYFLLTSIIFLISNKKKLNKRYFSINKIKVDKIRQ